MSEVRYSTAVATLKLVEGAGIIDLTEDEFRYLTGNALWLPVERARARRCIEATVYGSLDYLGYPRFAVPVEFIAANIAHYVHPVNIQTACMIMEGAEFIDNIINGVEQKTSASQLFAHVLKCLSGDFSSIDSTQRFVDQHITLKQI